MNRVISLVLIILAATLSVYLANLVYTFQHLSEVQKLEKLWFEDMALLQKENKLPSEWSKISEIKYNMLTPKTLGWIEKIRAPIKLNNDGDFLLELTFTDWQEAEKLGIVIQYHLIDKKSKNMVAEFGRTFIIYKDFFAKDSLKILTEIN